LGLRRRHHWVPKHYLRGFTNSKGLLLLYQRGSETPIEVSPKNAAVARDLYTDRAARDPEPDRVEKALADEIDGPSAKVLNSVRSGEGLSHEQWRRLALYLGAQMIRTPAVRGEFLERTETSYNEMTSEVMENPIRAWWRARRAKGASPRLGVFLRMSVALQRWGPDFLPHGSVWTSSLLSSARRLGEEIVTLPYFVFDNRGAVSLVTTDRPVVADRPVSVDIEMQIKDPDFKIMFAFDTRRLLMAGRSLKGARTRQVTELFRLYNKAAVMTANRFVFSEREQPWITKVFQQYPAP
jgi:hypothetical protein